MTQREIAFEIIFKTISDSSYTSLLMRKRIKEVPIIQRPFITNLVFSILRNYDFLIYQVKDEIKQNTSLRNKIIIAMALFERFYLDEKDYVINNEYVSLAKNKYDKAFINAILHKEIILSKSSDEYINYSLPKWLFNLLRKQYSEKDLRMILDNFTRIPKVYYRINKSKSKFSDFENIQVINDDLFTSNTSLINSEAMKDGRFYIQDINSASLYKHLDLAINDELLDVCSAPGSKLFNCLDIVKQENAYANEIHEHRLKLVKDKSIILGYPNINLLNYDGRELKNVLNKKFNKIILDVPCSGLGTIGRKPDLKYHINPESLDELQIIQKELLETCKDLLKDEGILLYSTCTLNKKENRKQIDSFLDRNNDFVLIEDETIINDIGDCFYYAKLKKV